MKTAIRSCTSRRIGVSLIPAVLALCLTPSLSHANGYLAPGTTHYAASTYDELDSPETVAIPAALDNSYYCRAPGFTGLDLLIFEQTISGPSSTSPTFVPRGADDGFGSASSAFSFIALATGTHIVGIDTTTFGTGTSSSARSLLECFNTTLFGNYNTVTVANPVNFLELKNISNGSLSALIVVRSSAGAELARFTRTIAAGERQDIGVHDLNGSVPNTFGSIQVAHTGGLGALVGNLSKYQVSGGNLNITATEPLRERVQK